MLGFAANGRINGSPVFRIFTPLEAISGPRDLSQMKDLAETHLLALVSSNLNKISPFVNGGTHMCIYVWRYLLWEFRSAATLTTIDAIYLEPGVVTWHRNISLFEAISCPKSGNSSSPHWTPNRMGFTRGPCRIHVRQYWVQTGSRQVSYMVRMVTP